MAAVADITVMRIAILSAMSKPPHEEARPAFRRIGSADVLSLQALTCRRLECAKVICLTSDAPAELDRLRQFCRNAGIPLIFAKSASDVRREVTADEEVLVMDEGLLPGPDASAALATERPVIYARDAHDAQWQAMERIDADHRWAGVMLLPGRCAEELSRLPEDVDVVSALLRIGLQRHVSIKPVPEGQVPPLFLTRDLGEMQLREHGAGWLTSLARPSGFAQPLKGFAERIALHFSTAHGGRTSLRASLAAALATLTAALVAIYFGYSVTALLFATVGSAAVAAHEVLSRLTRSFAFESERSGKKNLLLGWARDAVIALIVAFGSPNLALTAGAFLAAVFVLTLTLRPGSQAADRTAFLRDRVLICLALAMCTFAGLLSTGVMVLVLALLLDCAVQQRLTADNGALTTRG